MENQTWIKLFRKIVDHDIFNDESAFRVFMWILCSCDYKTGSMKSGRFWASERLSVNPITYYKILKRLEKKYDLVTLESNNKNTTILVKKWNLYQDQSNNESNNKVTTKEQQSNTTQELRIKKVLSKDNTAYGSEAINLILKGFEDLEGHKPTDPKPRFEAFNLVRNIKKTIKEVGHKEVTDEGIARVITAYYAWLKKQEWGSNVQNLSTVRRKFEIYKSILERSTHETN